MPSTVRFAACLLSLCFTVSVLPRSTDVKQLRVTGLKKPVEVIRDRWRVPHIYAKNSDDLFFVQGYITAQDVLAISRRMGKSSYGEYLIKIVEQTD